MFFLFLTIFSSEQQSDPWIFRESQIEGIKQGLQDNLPLWFHGGHGTGKKTCLSKSLEGRPHRLEYLDFTVNEKLSSFDAMLKKMYTTPEKTPKPDELLVVVADLSFLDAKFFENSYDDRRISETTCLIENFSRDSVIYEGRLLDLQKMRLVVFALEKPVFEIEDCVSTVHFPSYTGEEKETIYNFCYKGASLEAVALHILYYAEHPGIKLCPKNGKLKEPKRVDRKEVYVPANNFSGMAHSVRILIRNGTQSRIGNIGQIECLLTRHEVISSFKLNTPLTKFQADAGIACFAVPETVLRLRYPVKTYNAKFLFKDFDQSSLTVFGSSGGLSVYMALFSCLFNRSIPEGILFSGEVGLHGQINPIGGELVKFRTAWEFGIKRFVLHPYNCDILSQALPKNLLTAPKWY